MAIIGQGISLRGMTHEKFHYPFYLAAGITSDDVGKAVALDPSAANTVKLAGDGDTIIGQLVIFEERSVEGVTTGTVALTGGFGFTEVDSPANPIAVGDSVVGAGDGLVKARLNAAGDAKEAQHCENMVVEVSGSTIVVVIR